MRFGPTSLRVASILAKGLRRPKLRGDLRISEQTVAGETSYVIKIPEIGSYNRYGSSEYELLQLCDGTRTAAEIALELSSRRTNASFEESEVLEFLDSMEPAMWERSLGEKNLAVLERIRDERKGRLDQSSALYITFKAWDPDKFLGTIDKYFAWIFTKGFVIFSLAVFLIGTYIVGSDWSRIRQDTFSLYSFANKTTYDICLFWILIFVLGGIHEFGHGLTCKHFGGEVHQMGFMLIYFTPAFYTDTTDILLFPRGAQRQLVIFAGIWIELVICGLSALVWHFSVPGSTVNDIAYKALLLSGIQSAVLNLNPLIKADGYYALSQFLDLDNLREDSFAFLRAWAGKYLLRHDKDLPPASRRQRRIYFLYSVAAVVYGILLLVLGILFLRNILFSRFGNWGYVLTLGVVYYFSRNGLRRILPVLRNWIREESAKFEKWKINRAQKAAAFTALFLLLVPPVPSRITSDFILEPGEDAQVRAKSAGIVGQVLVHEGENVTQGQLLGVLVNPATDADLLVTARQLELASSNLRTGESDSDWTAAGEALRERSRLEQKLEVEAGKSDGLEIRAPLSGVVTTPDVDQKIGEFLPAGSEFCRLVDRDAVRLRILVRDSDIDRVRVGAKAEAKVAAFPYRTYSGEVERLFPAAALDRPVGNPQVLERMNQELTNYFAAEMVFANPDHTLQEGMTGTVKISDKNYPIAWQAALGAWHWLRSYVWW